VIVVVERIRRAGRALSAEVGYRKVLSRHPDRLNALTGLGRLLLRERRYEEAVEVWQKAVAIEPDAQFQNGFGAMAHSRVTCTYDLRAGKVIDVAITRR